MEFDMRYTLVLIAAFLLSASVSAQDQTPQRLDTITATHIVGMLSSVPTATNYSIAWFNNGFGRIDNPGLKLLPALEVDKAYVWFKITNPTNGSMDDFWITSQANWDAFLVSNNVPTLRAASHQFSSFNVSSSYTVPVISEPTTLEQRTAHLYVGYTSANTLMVVNKNDATAQWEWTVRGTKGITGWTSAATLAAAQAAANAAAQ